MPNSPTLMNANHFDTIVSTDDDDDSDTDCDDHGDYDYDDDDSDTDCDDHGDYDYDDDDSDTDCDDHGVNLLIVITNYERDIQYNR